MSIEEIIDQLIKKHGTSNPFKLAEILGILVVFEPLGSIYGYYSRTHRTKVIHINESASDGQKSFICGHELGHVILHPDTNTAFLRKKTLFSTDRIELEANHFAVQLLFSSNHFDGQLTFEDAIEHYGIPRRLIENNLSNKKI